MQGPEQDLKPDSQPPQDDWSGDGNNTLLQRAAHWGIQLSNGLRSQFAPLLRKVDWTLTRNVSMILALSFVCASSLSTFAATFALEFSATQRKDLAKSDDGMVSQLNVGTHYGLNKDGLPEKRKNILKRNIFNLDGTIPPEDNDAPGSKAKSKDLDFAHVPCSDQKPPVEVAGVIYTGDLKTSFVTMKDPKVESADVYKVGDVIIDHEEFELAAIGPGRAEFRSGDQKICVDLSPGKKKNPGGPGGGPGMPAPTETVELDQNFVNVEIGPGYANILNSARMVPDVDAAGKTTGFRLLSIVPGSLFDRIGMQNNDLVVEVNGVSLKDASQGFKLYQALQEEREITIGANRGGAPVTKKVRVK